LVGIGFAAKIYETLIADFNMPLSFYIDMALDLLLIWGWLNTKQQANKSLGAGMATCALNINRTKHHWKA
jgi:hypothetical protein